MSGFREMWWEGIEFVFGLVDLVYDGFFNFVRWKGSYSCYFILRLIFLRVYIGFGFKRVCLVWFY